MSGSQRSTLIRRCEALRTHCTNRQLATEAEMSSAWPEEDADDMAWIECYAQLRSWRWAEDLNSGRLDAETQVMAALRDDPKRIESLDGVTFDVYPKSFGCLLWFREKDWLIGYLTNYLADIKTAIASGSLPAIIHDPHGLRLRIAEEIAKQFAIMVGVAVSEGPGLPEPLKPIEVSPFDFYRVHQAFVEVNTRRLAVLDRIVKPSGGKGNLGWNVFFGTMSHKLRRPAAEIMEDQSLASLIAEARLAMPDPEDVFAHS